MASHLRLFRNLSIRASLLTGMLLWITPPAYSAEQVLTIALGQNKPPYTIQAPLGGIEYDLVTVIVHDMGYRARIVQVPNARAQLMFAAGKIDAVIGNSAPCLSAPYIAYQNVAISLSKHALAIHKIADLQRYRVAAFQNAHLFLGKDYAWMSMHNPHYQEVSPQQDGNRLLYRGRTDVVISDVNLFLFLNRQIQQEVDTSQPITLNRIFPPTLYRLAFHDAHLCEAFDRSLQRALQGDLYQRLALKYHAPTDRHGIPYFKPIAHP